MDNDPDFSWRPLDAPGEQPAAQEPEPIPMPTQQEAPAPTPWPEPVAEAESQPPEPPLTPAQSYGAQPLLPAPSPPPPADNYDDFEADDVPPPKGRGPASSRYLGVAILVAVAFVTGVLAQKHHDAGFSPPAKGLAALAGASGAGAHAGGAGGAAGAGAAAAGGGSSAAGGEGGGGRTPALTGTLVKVSGSDVVVKDAGGTDHVIHTTDRTRVSRQMNLADLADGSTVSVFGTPDQAGGLNATSVTQQNSSASRLGNGGPETNPTAAPSTSGSSAGNPGNGAVSGQS
jgi:hypothetical protein